MNVFFLKVYLSWDVDWHTSADPNKPCSCKMQIYQGPIVAYDPILMPEFKHENEANQKWCEKIYQEGWNKQGCANYTGSLSTNHIAKNEKYVLSISTNKKVP